MPDYRKIYWTERYLFEEVRQRFAATGKIPPVDFYMIVIWKAPRAKGYTRRRLSKKAGSFPAAVANIASSLHTSRAPKDRLQCLMTEWGFKLPMASAILTVLYPTTYTIYDARVCETLPSFNRLGARQFSDSLWAEYQEFVKAVRRAAPSGLSLRDKDRYLWGRSFFRMVEREAL